MELNKRIEDVLARAYVLCQSRRHAYLTPEHVLTALLDCEPFKDTVLICDFNATGLRADLVEAINGMETVPEAMDYELENSVQFSAMMEEAEYQMENSCAENVDVPHIVMAMFELEESTAAYLLKKHMHCDMGHFMSMLINEIEIADDDEPDSEDEEEPWHNLVTCLNDTYLKHNPLIGREKELERTVQVLCRKDKNNPLHVGEPGVGKTALVYGLVAMIERGDVPQRLKGCHVYQMDMGTMLAGTQFRGDFEKRIKQVMDGVSTECGAIVYIDEIHNIVGAGRGTDGALDASNMLKPYMERGDIRFIGSTTYEEYNRYMTKSSALLRRFQQIDIDEPSVGDTIKIIDGLIGGYEQFHGVTYEPGVVDYAVRMAAKHISNRHLPDKAIDLIDEAGAMCETHPSGNGGNTVDRTLIDTVLQRVCKVEADALKDSDNKRLLTLGQDMQARIFGQDEALRQVVEAVQMAKAGLLDEDKPLASLLFVGPTGVGKTEVARTLAAQLGIQLVRFDMSEYTEKHAVAKLIGSPAGYVGYDDGGLLTDAIRKSPNCVLLLDEIEKAHPDIYNILLQVMDYARLTDNKGRKADFRNVVLIMTSNAGAQHASQAQIGFAGGMSRGDAMLKQVKRTFKPEFINRLTATVVFRVMDKPMAERIMDKKLDELNAKLDAKHVTLTLTAAARQWLLDRGFTPEYGAREMDRAIARHLKPLLMREMLFGGLQHGGHATVDVATDALTLSL